MSDPKTPPSSAPASEREELAIGIDLGRGDDRSVVSIARKDGDGSIHLVASESVSNDLAAFLQKQEDTIRSLELQLSERDAAVGELEIKLAEVQLDATHRIEELETENKNLKAVNATRPRTRKPFFSPL